MDETLLSSLWLQVSASHMAKHKGRCRTSGFIGLWPCPGPCRESPSALSPWPSHGSPCHQASLQGLFPGHIEGTCLLKSMSVPFSGKGVLSDYLKINAIKLLIHNSFGRVKISRGFSNHRCVRLRRVRSCTLIPWIPNVRMNGHRR